jgi:hypothetical protein
MTLWEPHQRVRTGPRRSVRKVAAQMNYDATDDRRMTQVMGTGTQEGELNV